MKSSKVLPKESDKQCEEEEQHGSGTESDTQDTTETMANTVSKLDNKLQALKERRQICNQLIQQ